MLVCLVRDCMIVCRVADQCPAYPTLPWPVSLTHLTYTHLHLQDSSDGESFGFFNPRNATKHKRVLSRWGVMLLVTLDRVAQDPTGQSQQQQQQQGTTPPAAADTTAGATPDAAATTDYETPVPPPVESYESAAAPPPAAAETAATGNVGDSSGDDEYDQMGDDGGAR